MIDRSKFPNLRFDPITGDKALDEANTQIEVAFTNPDLGRGADAIAELLAAQCVRHERMGLAIDESHVLRGILEHLGYPRTQIARMKERIYKGAGRKASPLVVINTGPQRAN